MQFDLSYRHIWKVSLPIILGGVAQNIVNVTDTAFLGQLGKIELGAVGNAGILYFVFAIADSLWSMSGTVNINLSERSPRVCDA